MNKKFILSCILIFVIFKITKGQTGPDCDFGVERGPSKTTLRREFESEYEKSVLNYSVGMFFQYNFKSNLSFRTEISYEKKGGIYSLPTDIFKSDALTYDETFYYLTLPLLVKTSFGKKHILFLNGGGFLSYLLKETTVVENGTIDGKNNTQDGTNFYKQFDAGLTAGVGATMPIKQKIHLSLEIRDYLGLCNITRNIQTNSLILIFELSYRLKQKQNKNLPVQ